VHNPNYFLTTQVPQSTSKNYAFILDIFLKLYTGVQNIRTCGNEIYSFPCKIAELGNMVRWAVLQIKWNMHKWESHEGTSTKSINNEQVSTMHFSW